MQQIDPCSALTYSMCCVIHTFFVIALARCLTIKSICGSSLCRLPGYYAFDFLHMLDRRKRLKIDLHIDSLCTQFIDICFFLITPQIKFGNPASAVMYYKAQMGGRVMGEE